MSDLMECNVDGGTWLVGDLVVSREEFEQMTPDHRGEFSAVVRANGYLYYFDQLVPECDLSHGIKNMKIIFRLSPRNIVMKVAEY
jgi:hypothetical protein